MVRHSTKAALELDYPKSARFALEDASRIEVLRTMLRIYKSGDTDPQRFLDSLERAAGIACPSGERMFLNWDEAREMLDGGMAIGSHTESHELLAKLPPDRQYQELSHSRHVLEERLKTTVDTLAYPVGSRASFSAPTYAALAHAGYRAAFSFYGGVNQAGRTEPYNIRRIGVDAGMPRSLFRGRAALAAATGKDVIG
jgi:hypothetical protein